MRLDLTWLQKAYSNGLTPSEVIEWIYDQIAAIGERPIWISMVPQAQSVTRAKKLESASRDKLPLYGVPFAIKDNIDFAGLPTTAACPAYAYNPEKSAVVVEQLIAAGAIPIGKTNLDQFATGLVGTRTPYGASSSVFDSRYISGGSSSGSAVAVAKGLVSFALGTDTAGSGRVPAAFNNIVGHKPTIGRLSTEGVVPACRSLDCVSIFTLTAADAAVVLKVISQSNDAAAPWMRSNFKFGVPRKEQLQFFGDLEAQSLYEDSIARLISLGGEAMEFDFEPFKETASLLYSGPWVAERLAAISDFFDKHEPDLDEAVREIIGGGRSLTAVDAFKAQYRLDELKKAATESWNSSDFLLLPTTGTTYTISDVFKKPFALNTNLGYYTNFVNLLDLAATALPAGFRSNGLPFGVTLVGKGGTDYALLTMADRLHRVTDSRLGGTSTILSQTEAAVESTTLPGCTFIAVVGAHLAGQPLNFQLTSREARLISVTKTAPNYRLYALRNTQPEKPGLVRTSKPTEDGIEVEVWAIPTEKFGSFVAEIPRPLGIGTIELYDGALVKGFICEGIAIADAIDITQFGGWRNYLAEKAS